MLNRVMALLLSASLIVAAGCTAPSTPAATSAQPKFPENSAMAKIQTRGKLIVGVKTDLPYISYLNPEKNQIEGFEPQVAREVARAIFGDPNKVEFKQVVSRTRIPMVQEGAVDLVMGTLSITEERRKEIDFSVPYFKTGMRIMVPKGSAIKEVTDLKADTRVGIIKGSLAAKYLAEMAPQAKILEFETSSDYLVALQNKRLEAAVGDETTLISLVGRDKNMGLVGQPLSTEFYGIGLKKGTPEFVEFVDRTIRELKQSGRWKQIYREILGPLGVATPEAPPDEAK